MSRGLAIRAQEAYTFFVADLAHFYRGRPSASLTKKSPCGSNISFANKSWPPSASTPSAWCALAFQIPTLLKLRQLRFQGVHLPDLDQVFSRPDDNAPAIA